MPKRSASTRVATCPSNDVLAQLAAGSLAEERADPLFIHIAACPKCQETVDQLEQRADGVLAAGRRTDSNASGGRTLEKLIRSAQKLKSSSSADFTLQVPRPVKSSKSRSRVSVDGFVDGLKRSGLFKEAEVLDFLGKISTDDSGVLAKELINRGKLTTFQAKSLLRGKWKGFVLGNYVILDKLGQGGMGSVFKARHRRMGRVVCLKVMNSTGRKSPELMHRFRQEARTVGALNHPNIVVAHDADEANGIPFLVMEYIEGNDLAKHVTESGPVSADQALHLMVQAAQALSYAHSEGVVHRDIKPHNLLLSEQTESGSSVSSVKVLDMGLARFDSFMSDNPDASVHAAMTNTGVIMGTVDYMAPEQAICTRDADNRSDIYSLGCTLHYLLTGKPVYEAETIMGRLVAHREEPIPSLQSACDSATPELDAVFRRMIAKKAEDRYQSMDELLTDLNSIAAGEPPAQALAAKPAGLLVQPVEPTAIATVKQRTQTSKRSLRSWVVGLSLAVLLTAALVQMGDGTDFFSRGKPDESLAAKATEASEVEPAPAFIGHPATLRNGGKGRALFLLPNAKHSHFHDDQYLALTKSLKSRGIEWDVMGTADLPVKPKHGKVKQFVPTLQLRQFDAANYDAVFLVEGNLQELTHKNKEQHAEVKELINSAFSDGQVVSVVRSACKVVEETGVLKGMNYTRKGDVSVGTRRGNKGSFVKIQKDCDIDWATDVIFKELLKTRAMAESGQK